ncbi:MAG: UDP-3-O-(3-hydroxymyristoyl)glucosamine N-acyltransferase [Rhodospirillales bacterium 70-18]|nr:UDP-3-O-(3-hydroxymyristoyl)glucosamine N-acyltransferase [Rhodospirillales bacterium]OJY64070.1 MAG: UDP-3-O-(3-hydroxymyristoyl)glucosamine N-acyltransferase [Rhodospirillales bacterium 70-18]
MAEIEPIAGDPRFFTRSGPHRLQDVAAAAGGTVTEAAAGRLMVGVAPLQSAGPDQVSFLDNRRYAPLLAQSRAGAVILHVAMAERVPAGCVAIVTPEPYIGWARVAGLFHPPAPARPGIHRLACVDPEARIDSSAEIGPFAVVEAGAEIGPRCRIGPGAVIGAGVVLGPDCRVGAHAALSHTLAGARVYIYPGARIGQDGFGFATTATGFLTVPQLGRVILGDDVEVGANSTIDRGSAQDTVLGAGTRLDNLVQIGHNVRTGRCCVVVGQAGVAGSTVLEDFVTLAGQAGIAGHLHLGRGARIGAQAGVMADVPAGVDYLGSPAVPARDFFRQVAALRRLSGQGASTKARAARRDDKADAGGEPASKTDTD